MYKYIYPLIKWKIKPWLKYYIVKKGEGTPSEIITSASPITIANSLRRKFIKFIVGGNSVQDGDPSPTNEVAIQNVTGEVEVKVENKNKLKLSTDIFSDRGLTTTKLSDGGLKVTGTATRAYAYIYYDEPINLLPGTYTFSIKESLPVNLRLFGVLEDDTQGENITISSGTKSATKTLTEKYVKIRMLLFVTEGANYDLTVYPMLEEGSTATDYIEHEEQTATFPLSEGQVLHASDTIEDKIVQRRKTVIFDGTEKWYLINANIGQFQIAINDMTKNPILSNYFGYKLSYSANGKPYLRPANGSLFAEIGTELLPEISVSAWKAWLAEKYDNGTPVTLEYKLATPLEIPFTQAQRTAKAQIDSLHSYKGTTYISSSNEPSPIFEVQYYMEGE